MSQMLKLSDEVYEALAKAVREDDLTPAEWLATHLHVAERSPQEQSLVELTAGLTGVIDSTDTQSTNQTAFSTALAEEFESRA